MVLEITVTSILVLLIAFLRPSLIGGQPAGLEESPAVLEKLAPSSVVRGPFAPPPSEVLSGDGTEVTEKSANGLPSICETPTDTNRKRQRDKRAGGGSKGFFVRVAENGEDSRRESMSWREGSQTGSMSRERRTPSHCHLEPGPVNSIVPVTIHIRPKSLPFKIDVIANFKYNYRFDRPIVSHRSSFSTENIEGGWRIGHWTSVYLNLEYKSGEGYAYALEDLFTKYHNVSKLLPPTIQIRTDKADWYIGDLNQACLDEEKAQTEPTLIHVHGDKFFGPFIGLLGLVAVLLIASVVGFCVYWRKRRDANTATMTDARPPQRGGFELQPTDSQGVRPEFGSSSGEGVDLENVYGSPEDFAVFTARSDERTFTDMRTGGPIYANQCPEENMYDPIEDSLVRLGY